jgi:hypothetical protein
MDRSPLPPEHIGALESIACPTSDPADLATVCLETESHTASGRLEAWSFATLTFTLTVGRLGIDDNGHFRIAFRWTHDGGRLQTADPTSENYVSLSTTGAARLEPHYGTDGHTRPFNNALTVRVHGGYLKPGDKITARFGDRSSGSPGMRLQSFAEDACAFRVLIDTTATNHFTLLPERLSIRVGPAEPALYRLIGPTRRRVGEAFQLALRAEDAFGNPAKAPARAFTVVSNSQLNGLAVGYSILEDELVTPIGPLTSTDPGSIRLRAVFDDDGSEVEAPPLEIVQEGSAATWWADLHAQSGETVGINSIDTYFGFARDIALLDIAGHQGNDFQINRQFWDHLNATTAAFDEPGRFVTLPGYEWSGNTAVGGDRNVLFARENEEIRRSSHALVSERDDITSDVSTASDLFRALDGVDAVCIAHIGGRPADISVAHDGKIERAVEVHSCWGTFEWIMEDAFRLGHRLGLVCNSDDHKGRPGAAHPGASSFGSLGGLTAILADRLDRDHVMRALRDRRCYGTTGARIDIDLKLQFETDAHRFTEDPAVYSDATTEETNESTIGDIVAASGVSAILSGRVVAASPIERIEIRRGMETVAHLKPYDTPALGRRLRIVFEGAAYRGRGRQVRWDGEARLTGATIERVQEFAIWSPRDGATAVSPNHLTWRAVTSGNSSGVDIWFNQDSTEAGIEITTPQGIVHASLSEIGLTDQVFAFDGLGLQLRLFRLPSEMDAREVEFEVPVERSQDGDTPIWIAVTLEDGHRAWTSPIYWIEA